MNKLLLIILSLVLLGIIIGIIVYFMNREEYESRNLHFIHIPKNAGSSILQLEGINTKYGKLTRTGGYHTMSLKKTKKLYPHDKTFIICRNPYDRFLSACGFYSKNWKQNSNFNNPNKIINILMSDNKTQRLHLPVMNNYKNLHYLDGKNEIPVDCVFWPQWYWLKGTKPDFIIRYENLQDDFEKLKQWADLDKNIILPHKNKSSHKNIDKKTKELIYKFYKKDFELFGYNK